MAELLARSHLTEMHLYHGRAKRTYTVEQRNAGVRVGARIEDDAIVAEAHLLHLVDEQSFHVALEIFYVHLGIHGAQLRQIALHRLVAIDTRLSHA